MTLVTDVPQKTQITQFRQRRRLPEWRRSVSLQNLE
jgi:hypothetical protein